MILKKNTFMYQVPDEYEQPFLQINNTARRTFSGMVLAMDEAVREHICLLNILNCHFEVNNFLQVLCHVWS